MIFCYKLLPVLNQLNCFFKRPQLIQLRILWWRRIQSVLCSAVLLQFAFTICTLLSLTSPIAQHIVNIFGAYTFLPLRLTKDLRLWCHQTKCGKQNELRRQNVCITKREETMWRSPDFRWILHKLNGFQLKIHTKCGHFCSVLLTTVDRKMFVSFFYLVIYSKLVIKNNNIEAISAFAFVLGN